MARAHGTGTLVKRGKYFMAKWMVKGKLYTRSTKCTNKRDAEKKLEEFTKPYREKTDIEVLENLAARVRVAEANVKKESNDKEPAIKIALLLDIYKSDLSTSELKQGSEHTYEAKVRTFEKFIKKKFVHEVTIKDVEKFLQHIKQKNSAVTYNAYISTMQTLFRVAMKHDYRIRSNVWDGFTKLSTDKSKGRRELTDEEVKKLCEEAYKSKKFGDELGLMFEIAVYTGLRKSDCKVLKWQDVDMDTKMFDVLPIKTSRNGRKARLPIHPKLYEKLKTLVHDESGYVMPHIANAKSKTFDNAIDDVFKSCKIETSERDANGKLHITTGFHAFRHYFASNCVKNRIPISVVQTMLAHSSASMSLKYTHTFDSDLRLPDYDGETGCVTLKKTTIEALDKAKGIHDLDDFIMNLLQGKPSVQMNVKTKSDIELDKALDEIFEDKK